MNKKIQYLLITYLFISVNIFSQSSSLRGEVELYLSNKVYKEYTGITVSGNFPVINEKLSIGPYLNVLMAKINSDPNRTPVMADNPAFLIGAEANYYIFDKSAVSDLDFQTYFSLGLGYRFNQIAYSGFMPPDNIKLKRLEDDLIIEFSVGIMPVPKSGIITLYTEATYQIRNPELYYQTGGVGLTKEMNFRRHLNLNAFLFKVGLQINI
jgi:hypothetical protein